MPEYVTATKSDDEILAEIQGALRTAEADRRTVSLADKPTLRMSFTTSFDFGRPPTHEEITTLMEQFGHFIAKRFEVADVVTIHAVDFAKE